MAKRTANQKTGDIGEGRLQQMFKERGYASHKIEPDYGEDFFVFCQDGDYIEPFRIFVQSKATATEIKFRFSDWTAYCDPMTVRNWVLNNELTIVVRQNLKTGEARFSIPEEDIDYWAIDFSRKVPIQLLKSFDNEVIEQLVWRARLRHYDRIVRLVRPNDFEPIDDQDTPEYRKFVLEFLVRLGILSGDLMQLGSNLQLYNSLLFLHALGVDVEPSSDMSIHDKLRYSACLDLVLRRLRDIAGGGNGLSKPFADDCACLLVQFIIDHEKKGNVIAPKTDSQYRTMRCSLLQNAASREESCPVLTEWCEGAFKPTYSGVYQRNDGGLFFSFWTGTQWLGRSPSFIEKASFATHEQFQELPWRGVAPMTGELEMFITAVAASCAAS